MHFSVPLQFCAGKMQPALLFFLHLERTGTASTDVNYEIDNHITYFLCVLDADKKQLEPMWCELALNVFTVC
ncbi:unnamed protein product, partial [Staurois parvus]